MPKLVDRRLFLGGAAACLLPLRAEASPRPENNAVGPMVGHVSDATANVWFRPSQPGLYILQIAEEQGNAALPRTVRGTSQPENDSCIVWQVPGLRPATRYRYSIVGPDGHVFTNPEWYFTTAPPPDEPSRVRLAFGSCALNEPLPLWSQMEDEQVEGLVLLGDTPYIDSTDLEVARARHRGFLQIPQLAALIRHTPTWGTWDDHDFGANDSDGRLKGKENTRRAFVEYRANREFGEGDAGIYTKFQYGPVEVFLLDTRWFARTEPSPVDAQQPTLLGKKQWKWLQDALLASQAPFKVIACGMIWDDKENSESDDWGTYAHEREALFRFVGEHKISGVVLVGGDIHCSRLLKYETESVVGYPIHQFIVSPIHKHTIPSLNVAHPNLVRGEAVPHVWLRLDVDTSQKAPQLHAQWIQMEGRPMWDITLTEADLKPRA